MLNCVMNGNCQPKTKNLNTSISWPMRPVISNVQIHSVIVQNPVNEIKFFFNGFRDEGSKAAVHRPEIATNVKSQYPQMQTSYYDKLQSYDHTHSTSSSRISKKTVLVPRSVPSPHKHHKTFCFSVPWITENSLSIGGYCHISTPTNGNQSFMTPNRKFTAYQRRVISQSPSKNWYWTSPRYDPHVQWKQAKGTYHSSFGNKSSSAQRSQSRRIPPHERIPPVHLQNKNKINRFGKPRKKFSPCKKGWKTNCTKPSKIRRFLNDILVKCSLFKGVYCDDVARKAISATIKEMYTHDLKTGDILVRQGDIGDAFFLVEYGKLDVLVWQKTQTKRNFGMQTIKVSEIKAEETFGETALMYNTKRSATLKAAQFTRVWVLEANQFYKIRYLIKELRNKIILEQKKFLSSIQLFAGMRSHELSNLTQTCHEVKFKPGDSIVSSADTNSDNHMYIIKKGKAWVVRDRRNSTAICRGQEIGEGDYFMRKLFQKQDLSTLTASSNVQCLKITEDDFDFLVSPYLNKCTEKHGDSQSGSSETISGSEDELPKSFKNRVLYKLKDFTDIAVAGTGSFGLVKLVKTGEGSEKRVFALKEVEKNKAINTNQCEHMKNERRAMFMMDSPFIVKLFATYQDSTCVYFLLEKVLGGELFHLLRRLKSFNESMSRFYTGCVVVALEHVHSHGIIYRDLKPENLLITGSGYIKLTDFGFAKKRNQSMSLCGTPAYLAPELITCGIQNFGVDWWSLGILLFEMLVGQEPFRDSENITRYENILTSFPILPDILSWESQELIHGLLEKNAFRRLGSGPGGARDIKKQSWFGSKFREDTETFDWKRLEKCMLNAPYKPELTDDEDVRYISSPGQKTRERTELCMDFDSSLFLWCEEF